MGLDDYVRHPATYLLEAADDIIYLCDDIEDGVKKGYINWENEYEKIKKTLNGSYSSLFNKIDAKETDLLMDVSEKVNAQVRNFRNYVQGYLFSKAVDNFFANYEMIMSNQPYDGFELLGSEKSLVDELKRITKECCFCCREVIMLELKGSNIIRNLFDFFIPAILDPVTRNLTDVRTFNGKLFSRISPNFLYSTLIDHVSKNQKNLTDNLSDLNAYDKIQLVTDFISGMTDSYAKNLYQELMGIK